MPEAVATTKRKFHRLLDTLTSYANAPANPPESATPLTARERLDHASDRVRKRQRNDGSLSSIESRLKQSASSNSLSHKAARGAEPKTTGQTSHRSPPQFSPWSQDTFLQRLHTFSRVTLWHPKPDAINEVEWAKRGWQCIDVNIVACQHGCGSRVVIDLQVPQRRNVEEGDDPNEYDDSLEDALVARYKDEIIAGHAEHCLWRKTGCKDDIQRLQIVRPAVWQPTLRARYCSLQAIADSLENLSILQYPLRRSIFELYQTLAELTPDILPACDAPRTARVRAFELAMLGWSGSSELNADLLTCNACFQRIGLWMYQPGYHARTVTSEDIDEDDPMINPLQMHREYCPWRSAASQQASGTLAGLNASDILFKVVATHLKEKRRRAEEQTTPVEREEPAEPDVDAPKLSRKDVEQQDRERESRLQKLKRLLTIKRSSRPTAKDIAEPSRHG